MLPVLLMYALEAYKAENGAYPGSLNDLQGSGIIKHVPEDRFDGKTFRYRATDDGNNYLLYSVGPNCRDDGGAAGWLGGYVREFSDDNDYMDAFASGGNVDIAFKKGQPLFRD